MKDRVFISYRRADAGPVAGRLRDLLEDRFPGRIFLDVDDIAPGQDFVAAIEGNLASAAALIVVIGPGWLQGSTSGTKLGDADDYVTRELRTALRLGVPLLPVLAEGASMPGERDLPEDLQAFARSNAIDVRHAGFRRDCEPLVAIVYDALELRPPTPFERLMESIASRTPFGSKRFRFDEPMREHHAMFALFFGIFAVAVTGVLIASGTAPDIDILLAHLAGAYAGIIGRNSRRRRKQANAGLVLLSLSFVVGFALFTLSSLDDSSVLRTTGPL